MTTLYERIGGDKPINQLCRLATRKIFEDARTSSFFVDVDFENHVSVVTDYFVMGMGGPDNYSAISKNMVDVHSKLRKDKGLNETHFKAVIEICKDAMIELSTSEDIRKDLEVMLESHREIIVGKEE